MSQPKRFLLPQEYLAIERAADFKSEYFAGEMFAMAGVSRAHSLITGNVFSSLHNQLQDRNREVHASELRISISSTELYTYPDVVAYCGKGEFEDAHADTLVNPQLIVEVLSPSTEAYDRGAKFAHYRSIPSLQEYLLISQDRVRVERYRRTENDEFLFERFPSRQDVVELQSIGAELVVGDIHAKLDVEEEPGYPKAATKY